MAPSRSLPTFLAPPVPPFSSSSSSSSSTSTSTLPSSASSSVDKLEKFDKLDQVEACTLLVGHDDLEDAYGDSELGELDLDLGNRRPRLEQWRILAFGTMLQMMIDFATLPLILAYDKFRFKTRIDTGKTGKCRLCVYVPRPECVKDHGVARGVVMHLNGGGWTITRPETEASLCRFIADTVGCVVIAPDYRKAPKYPYPHALEQAFKVCSWVANGGLQDALRKKSKIPGAPSLRVDATRIGLSGGSAGSNLACSLATLCVSRPLPRGARISAQGLLYPVLNLAVPYAEKLRKVDPGRNLPQWMSKFFLRAYLPPPRLPSHPLVSPALAPDSIASRLPPTVILTAAYDYLAHEADHFALRLDSLGVRVKHRRFEEVGHAFDGIPALSRKQRRLNYRAREEAWGLIGELMKEELV